MKPSTFRLTVLSAKVIAIAACALVLAPATAEILPFFILEHSVWKATDIVLATEGDAIDGRLSVVETWRGGLKPGDAVNLPQLADFASEESRRLYRRPLPAGTPNADATVSGDRMILFLVRPTEDDPGATILPDSLPWKPAGYFPDNDFKISIAWVENGETFALGTTFSDGPLELVKNRSALDIRALVAASDMIAAGIAEAVRTQNATLAIQAAFACEQHGLWDGATDALRMVGTMGDSAVPALRTALTSGAPNHMRPVLIQTLAVAGGTQVAPDLVKLLETQLRYWKELSPQLEPGWWNSAPAEMLRNGREIYGQTLTILQALRPMNYEPAKEVVQSLRDLWASAESLQGIGDDQMVKAIDQVLEGQRAENKPS